MEETVRIHTSTQIRVPAFAAKDTFCACGIEVDMDRAKENGINEWQDKDVICEIR